MTKILKINRVMKNVLLPARAISWAKMLAVSEKISQPKRSKVKGNLKKIKEMDNLEPVLKLIKRHWQTYKSA